jgi:hypothetical protein
MKFWRITHPEYEGGDYSHSYINGDLEHPFGLPGVVCDVCGETWGGSGYLPALCPKPLRRLKAMKEGWPIPRSDHEELQRKVMRALRIGGEPFVAVRPGDTLQPGFLSIPSRPEADFLWASIGTLVVSERINRLFLSACRRDVASFQLTVRKVGKRSARLPPISPRTGEPEDMLREVPTTSATSGIGRYFEILLKNESGYPAGSSPRDVCSGCKRETIGKRRKLKMTRSMWTGSSIFYMATTLYIIVTDDLRKRIERMRPTNVLFEEA